MLLFCPDAFPPAMRTPPSPPFRLLLLLQSARSLWCRDTEHSGVDRTGLDWTGSLPNETYPFIQYSYPHSSTFLRFHPLSNSWEDIFFFLNLNLCPNCLSILPITYRGFVSSTIPTRIHPGSFSFIHFLIPGWTF